MAAMFVDALIILMLTGGVAFAWVVNARVKRLMTLMHELEPTVQQFSQAVDKSEHSVVQMQRSLAEKLSQEEEPREPSKPQEPLFTTGRIAETRDIGVKVIRDKQDLVRRFFDVPRTEGRV